MEASGGFSAPLACPIAVIIMAIAVAVLWFRDREAGCWLVAPALWPASQYHHASLAMPILKDRWWLGALLALQIPGSTYPRAIPGACSAGSPCQTNARKRASRRRPRPGLLIG